MASDSSNLGVVVNTSAALAPGPEPLTGKLVRLERITHNHVPDLYKNLGSYGDAWIWLGDGPFSTISDFVRWLNPLIERNNSIMYAIILLSGPNKGKAVGLASLRAHLNNRVMEIGVLFGPQLKGTRAGTEVVFLLGRLVFEKLNYRRLEWKCDFLNLPSKKAAERYGFVYEGTLRQCEIVDGKNKDLSVYSLIDSEWPMCEKVFDKWLGDGNFDEHQLQRNRMEEIRESLRSV